MTITPNNEDQLFTCVEETGFELPASPGVIVRQLLTTREGHAIDVFHLTIPPGAEITASAIPTPRRSSRSSVSSPAPSGAVN